MQTLSEEEYENLNAHLREKLLKAPPIINAHVSADERYARLFRLKNKKPVSIAKDAREFALDEPFYVRRFDIYSKEVVKAFKGLEIRIVSLSGEERVISARKLESKNADGIVEEYLQYVVKEFVQKVIVRSTLPFRSLSILRILVTGYSLEQFEEISGDLGRAVDALYSVDNYISGKKKIVHDLENDANLAREKLVSLQEEGNELEVNVASLRKSMEDAEKEEKNCAEKLSRTRESLRIADSRLQDAMNNKSQLDEKVAELNKQISQKMRELQGLVSDRNLISDEYRDYVSEGKQQSRYYLLFLLFPMAVIWFCAWQLYNGASNILQSEVNDVQHLIALFLQRVPFATAIALVVAVCWKLSSELIRRVMLIHGQRLTLAKLLVIAKDVVYSSSVGLELTEEERLRHRMLLKLDMLKSHLANELGNDFEYRAVSSRSHHENNEEASD